MKNIEIKTINEKSKEIKYTDNLISVCTFLNHSEDKILVKTFEDNVSEISIYDNDKLIFIGDKYELFKIILGHNNNN